MPREGRLSRLGWRCVCRSGCRTRGLRSRPGLLKSAGEAVGRDRALELRGVGGFGDQICDQVLRFTVVTSTDRKQRLADGDGVIARKVPRSSAMISAARAGSVLIWGRARSIHSEALGLNVDSPPESQHRRVCCDCRRLTVGLWVYSQEGSRGCVKLAAVDHELRCAAQHDVDLLLSTTVGEFGVRLDDNLSRVPRVKAAIPTKVTPRARRTACQPMPVPRQSTRSI